VSNVIDISSRGTTTVDLSGALVESVNREAARRTVRQACDAAVFAAFEMNDPVHAISQLRDAVAVINALSLNDQPREAS
jgi:hypothetical protein